MEQSNNLQDIYTELISTYDRGISQQDAQLLTTFVRDGSILMFKTEEYKDAYVDLRLKRADAFGLFGKFTEATKEYRLALMMCDASFKWEVYLAWCQSLFLQFILTKDETELKAIAAKIAETAEKGKSSVITGKDKEYRKMTFTHFEAFFFIYLGKRDKAKALYASFKFKPIPIPQVNDDSEMIYLFANFAKGLAVAIELEDQTLLDNLLKVVSIDDQILYGEKNLFLKFHTTLMYTMDMRSELSTDLNQLFNINTKIMTEMKQLSFFLTSIQTNMLGPLDGFFNGFTKK